MERRRFLRNACCGGVALAAAAAGRTVEAQRAPAQRTSVPDRRRKYAIEIEIFEGKGNCVAHKVGEKFRYPEDRGKICPWLQDSMNAAIRVLEYGGTLPWMYEGTPYQKVMDAEGITTEFIRCPDPTSAGVVAKITRRKV